MNNLKYIETLPFDSELKRRIAMTCSCMDCAAIPKVEHAGEIFHEKDIHYQLMHNGIRVIEGCYHGRGVTEIIRLLKGHHEPQEEKAFNEILKYLTPHSLMVELGSHWSYYSMWLKKSIPSSINYMIEPDPSNLEVGKKNFEINQMKGQFFNAYVGDKSSPPSQFHCESDNEIRMIPQICIDDFVVTNKIERIDLLFVDIQGYEYKMLEGSRQSIKNGKIRFLFISTHHHLISNDPIIHQRCMAFLKEHNAHVIVSHSVAESYSGDGLIVVSFSEEDRKIPEIQISRNYPSNSLFREVEFDLEDARQEVKCLREQLQHDQQAALAQQNEIDSILKSRSWKLASWLSRINRRVRAQYKAAK